VRDSSSTPRKFKIHQENNIVLAAAWELDLMQSTIAIAVEPERRQENFRSTACLFGWWLVAGVDLF
jgi:hypothetical protein